MGTIRRANRYASYFLALVISGLFSLIGRPGPAWAEERKSEHNAQIFQQLYAGDSGADRAIGAKQQREVTTKSEGLVDNRTIQDRYVYDRYVYGGSADASRVVNGNPLLIEVSRDNRVDVAPPAKEGLRSVIAKIQKGDTLDTADTAFLLSLEAAATMNQLSNQLNVLIKMVKEMQDALKEDAAKE